MSAQTTIVITGASDGIGAVVARSLAGPSVNLILVSRSAGKLASATEATGAAGLTADYAHLDQVRDLARQISERVDKIDVLINNAGGMFAPQHRTADGHEPNFQINHLAGFLLTNLLHERLAAAGHALVLNTASLANLWGRVVLDDLDYQRRHASQMLAYGSSKLMNILFARGIAERWKADGIVAAAVHPGTVATSFGRESRMAGLLYRSPLRRLALSSPEQGAAPLIALVRRGADPTINGVYFHRFHAHGIANRQARDQTLIDGLWERSRQLAGVPSTDAN